MDDGELSDDAAVPLQSLFRWALSVSDVDRLGVRFLNFHFELLKRLLMIAPLQAASAANPGNGLLQIVQGFAFLAVLSWVLWSTRSVIEGELSPALGRRLAPAKASRLANAFGLIEIVFSIVIMLVSLLIVQEVTTPFLAACRRN